LAKTTFRAKKLIQAHIFKLASNAKLNVLHISIDDLNEWVGCLEGQPQIKTPNIDRLADRGILFTNARCADFKISDVHQDFTMPSCRQLRSDRPPPLPQDGRGKRGQTTLGDKT